MKTLALTLWAVLLIGSLNAQNQQVVTQSYLDLKEALYSGDVQKASQAGKMLLTFSKREGSLLTIEKSLSELINSSSIDNQRTLLAKISEPIWNYIKSSKNNAPLFYVQCQMTRTFWIDDSKAFKNPFYGKQMSSCGKITDSI